MDEPFLYRSEAFAEDLDLPEPLAEAPRWNLFLAAVALTVGAWLVSGSLLI
jgi:hypothetical protein